AGQHLLVETDVLGMCVTDRTWQLRDERSGVDPLPEEVTRVEVGGEVQAERAETSERLVIVDRATRMQLHTEQQIGMLGPGELTQLHPIRRDGTVELRLIDAFEIREPAARREV